MGWLPCFSGSVPFAETLQNSCGTLVDSKGNPVVDGKSRLSPIAQDVLSMFLLTLVFRFNQPLRWVSDAAFLSIIVVIITSGFRLTCDSCCRMCTIIIIISFCRFPR